MENYPTIKDLLEAGVHFGHQTKRWNPKMSKYIFTEKNGIHIIDLSKTLEKLSIGMDYLTKMASLPNSKILFVGTKRQAQEVVEKFAKEADVNYVTNRWVGGLLTNMNITRKNISNMLKLEEMLSKGVENRTKQEISLMSKELERLEKLYGGIKNLNGLPSVMVLADPHHERLALKEAMKLKIPIVAIVDTNCDPDEVNYPIPGNDDAIGAITLFFGLFSKIINSSRKSK